MSRARRRSRRRALSTAPAGRCWVQRKDIFDAAERHAFIGCGLPPDGQHDVIRWIVTRSSCGRAAGASMRNLRQPSEALLAPFALAVLAILASLVPIAEAQGAS
jgi:hypothetical protein